LGRGIDPAGLNATAERLGYFGIDLSAKAGQATEGCLDVTARASKAVVEIKVTKSGVEIVKPHQTHHASTEPDAFGVSGRPVNSVRSFHEFICLALIFLGGFGGLGRIRCLRLGVLILGVNVAALGNSASDTDQEDEPGDGEVAHERMLKLKHPSTHKFPDLLLACGQL
jgi:hypothetical protein